MKTKRRSDEIKFIDSVETPSNPRDAFYINEQELIRGYMFVMLLGCVFMLYWMIY